MAAAVKRAESDIAVYHMLPVAHRTYPGAASWCQMDSKVLCGSGEWPLSLCWNVVGLRCEIQSAPSLSASLVRRAQPQANKPYVRLKVPTEVATPNDAAPHSGHKADNNFPTFLYDYILG